MKNEKKFTAREVANLLLSKVSEILNKSELAKGVFKLQEDSQKGVHLPFGDEGKSFAGTMLRWSKQVGKEQSKKNIGASKKEHKDILQQIKEAPSPNLPKSEKIEKKEAEDRYVVDTKKRDKYGRVTIYDKKREIEFKAKLKDEDSMEKSQGTLQINPKLLSQDPTHTYKNAKVKSVKENKTKDGVEHVVEYMEGEHKGKWTQAHEKDLSPIEKEENCSSCGKMHKKETKFDRCVEHVKEQSPEVKSPEAVCVSQGVRPEKWGKSEELDKAETENSKKLGYKLSEAGKKEVFAEESDKAFEVKGKESKSSDDARLSDQLNPEKNPKEQAEGNNELAGTTPTQVGEDGKNKPGFSEMRSDLKLAKWLGRMEEKRKAKSQNVEKSENFEDLTKMADISHYTQGKKHGQYGIDKLSGNFGEYLDMHPSEHLKHASSHREHAHKALRHESLSPENRKKHSGLHTRIANFHSAVADHNKKINSGQMQLGSKEHESSEKDLKDTYEGIQEHWKKSEEIESSTLIKSAESISGMHKVEYYTYKELNKSESLEKALDKEKRLKDIKESHLRVQSKPSTEKAKEKLEQLNRETRGMESKQHIKGVHTEPGAYISHTEKGSKISPVEQHAESQRVREESQQIKPNLTRSEKDGQIRELQKSGLSPEQILKKLKKEEECEKEGKRMLTKAERDNQIRELQKSGLSPEQIVSKLKKEESVPKEPKSHIDLKSLREKHKEKVAEWEKRGANPQDVDSMVYLHDEIEKKKQGK